MTWTLTEKNAILNSFASSSEVGRQAITLLIPQYRIVHDVKYNSSDEYLWGIAAMPRACQGVFWTGLSYTNQIDSEPEKLIEQLAWDDVEGMKAYAAEFREEELGLANAGLRAYAQKLEEEDHI